MKILITGAAGFIGYSLSHHISNKQKKSKILGIDNIDNYYSTKLKRNRIKNIRDKNFYFSKIDICNLNKLEKIFKRFNPDVVIHLAAQAGVRYSIDKPRKYINSNILGYFNILEMCRNFKVKKIIYASSSSVYGDSKNFPLEENDKINPKNVYALSKKFDEELSSVYSNLYNLKIVGLRLFTVYGEWGRPDMFIFKYLRSALLKKVFYLNNYGNHSRDFTYIGDVVKIISKLISIKQKRRHEIFNVCSGKSIKLMNIIKIINKYVSVPLIIKKPFQKADVIKTHGNNKKILSHVHFKKFTNIHIGLEKTIDWYLCNINNFK
jgi:UDP-glucuronate 4-epimerase